MQAQTTKSAVDLLTPATAKKSSKNAKDDGGSDFLSMVLDAAASKAKSGEKISENDVKNIVKSVAMQASAKEKAASDADAKIASALSEKLDETTKNELFENANFMQLLQVLEILNGGERVSKFPNFTDKIANFLSVPQNVEKLANVKSVSDLLELAKQFDLGLENLSVSTEDVENLNKIFKNLAQKEFFAPVAPASENIYDAHLKNKVEETINQNKIADETPKLNDLLKQISEPKNQNLNAPQTTKETPKTAPEQSKIIEPRTENLKPVSDGILVKEEDEQSENLAEISVSASDEGKKSKNEKPLNLKSLLFPEREAQTAKNNENSSANESEQNRSGEQGKENPLNAMVRDISGAARSQLQEKAQVKETLNNFSQTLREQAQNYKAPITRFNITLNPLNLGEVEITMVNRGNNLHINFNSTTTTMNIFLQNQAEFKNSLVNMGFTELEMNFNDQRQKQEQGRETYKRRSNSEFSESGDEAEQNLLEIVVPRYI